MTPNPASAGLVLLAAFPAQALDFGLPDAGKGNVYGQLSPVWLSFDDGAQSIGQIVDNNDSNSRIGVLLDWSLDDDARLTFNFETALGFFQSNQLTMQGLDGTPWIDWSTEDIRKLELFARTDAGTFWAGQGDMATYAVAEFDESGTVVAGYSDYQAIAGGFAFVQADGTPSQIVISDVFVNLEGSRRFRLRYDSPDRAGFTLSAAAGNDELNDKPGTYYDAALRYVNDHGRFHMGGGIGYALTEKPGESDSRAVMGSIAVLDRPTGLNTALAAGRQIDGGSYIYAKLGWITTFVPAGQTALAAEYYGSSGIGFEGSGRSWGLMALQRFDRLSTEFYIGYRHYALTGTSTAFRDSESFVFGSRWTF
ncbi:porin [Neotabrizicola shimadae]|uniref:Porin n=1 Tax=Neotabrizicola shimadae TaxID=2807096 RepID=A0A8G1EEM8_9RHOB|nr:porin [Neotabrizicola shimadae]QYZ70829.1 porin [Neotabrizicola shimadae]